MPAKAVIRLVRPDEFAQVGELTVNAYRTLGDGGDKAYDAELRDVGARARTSDVLVAELDGSIVGTATFVPAAGDLAEVEDSAAATIRMVGVAPEVRGRGIGAALVLACIERARAQGCARIRLDTRTSMTSAHRLYERLGFMRDPRYDWSPAPGIDLLAYVLDLNEPGRKEDEP